MKKIILTFLVLFIIPFSLLANGSVVRELRNKFYSASNRIISVEEYKKSIDSLKEFKTPVFKGYESMYFMLISRQKWNPYLKYSNFLKGKELLEEAIKMEPKNVELVYLRYCIQRKLPGFLNYSDMINVDKLFILKSWPFIKDNDLKEKIKTYFIDHKIEKQELFNKSNA